MTSRTLKSLQGRRASHTGHENSVALVGAGANLVAANPGCLPHTRTLRAGKGLANLRRSLAFPLPPWRLRNSASLPHKSFVQPHPPGLAVDISPPFPNPHSGGQRFAPLGGWKEQGQGGSSDRGA